MKIIEQRSVGPLGELFLASLRGRDDLLIEFVDTVEPAVPKDKKWVMMISTQFGCPIGCAFCDAGALEYKGNLSAEEMLAQIDHIVARERTMNVKTHPKLKIHFARMGEPTLNPAALDALRLLGQRYPHPGIMASLSTVAPDAQPTERFLEGLIAVKDRYFSGGRFQMQFSVHATKAQEREEIVPVKTWDFGRIADYGRRFVVPGDRKVTLNFAVAPTSDLDADAIIESFDVEKFLIKITPINPTAKAKATGLEHVWFSAPEPIAAWQQRLKSAGFDVILSPSEACEIEAETSCGQLWARVLKKEAVTARLTSPTSDSRTFSCVKGAP